MTANSKRTHTDAADAHGAEVYDESSGELNEAPREMPPPPEPLLLCKAHAGNFPDEDPNQPLSAWSTDPVTFEVTRAYCRRCDNANKRRYAERRKQEQAREKARPKGERQVDQLAMHQRKLEKMIARGDGDTQLASGERFYIWKLRRELGLDQEDAD